MATFIEISSRNDPSVNVVVDAALTDPDQAQQVRGMKMPFPTGTGFEPCPCGYHVVRVRFDARPGYIEAYVRCPSCGREPDYCEFSPVPQDWNELFAFIVYAWNEALDLPSEALPEQAEMMAAVCEASLGPLPGWRERKCSRE